MSLFDFLDETAPMTGRLALGIEYNGQQYMGWQRLQHGPSVQAALERALSRIAAAEVEVLSSGRTDSGVHATRQIAHFDAPSPRTEKAWMMGANAILPRDITIHWIREVPSDFHARFSALGRRYRYVIYNRASPPALEHDRVTWHRTPLDHELMHQAGQALVGEHDFSAYRASSCQSVTPWRFLHHLEVSRHGPLVVIDIQGNAFLHHMVRNIAGVLMAIGDRSRPVAWAEEVLQGRDRTIGGITAPAAGLYFIDSCYDDYYGLPAEPLGPSFLWHTGEWSGERAVPVNAVTQHRRHS
ncbi:tRNA pseudouridine(38-40) synthase TruA [Larsenimonas rhizosphaerae]|uniref:tRNA pseudouridine synthase A n=1 Tax=Larsenimonas rhizosphaerae TaxID=2944682 RepID=A0AA41ZFM7_9GAMM|nr:tRNA pseudouridine(38-40) synthase TruA [Larsenimonas rhizosphaerae]MCM2130585.1 tRNA pseudouridine(38-40) synthase TruA [Larsenimonas rhizosphaerae]MCX2523289.1 tRNA pseudouridine(38-40) synthase TruA [Larsenimonas rhizosphaerae]